jgi:rSAM/selenodomain-associated transferase 1
MVLSLYKNFVLDLLETLRKGKHAVKIFFFPPDSGEKVSDWLGKDYSCWPQRGNDLGERMKDAFTQTFSEGFLKVLLVGSDIPDLSISVLDSAFEFDEHDAVIGPAFDGGYYLIGFKNNTFLPEIFEGMSWGTGMVFRNTMEIFKRYNYKVNILPVWRDVDRFDDLKALIERNKNTGFAHSRTMAFMSDNFKKLFKENIKETSRHLPIFLTKLREQGFWFSRKMYSFSLSFL